MAAPIRNSALAILAVALLTGCATLPSASADPTQTDRATTAATQTASPEPTETPQPTPVPVGRLAVDGIAQLVTDDLVVRSLPEISEASEIYPVTLSEPKLLFVLDGPVNADGHDWYFVAPFDEFLSDIATGAPRLGWVAAAGDGEDWIAPWTGECPEASIDALRFRSHYLRVACFGDAELTLEGELGWCTYITPGTVTPSWLASQYCELFPYEFEGELIGPFTFHLPPADFVIRNGERQPVRVTGRFDHPAARTCEFHPLDDSFPREPELVILGCRNAFVVSLIEPLSN